MNAEVVGLAGFLLMACGVTFAGDGDWIRTALVTLPGASLMFAVIRQLKEEPPHDR